MRIQQVLDQIDGGAIALPEFQRGYVWNREQVRGLFASLYRGYPIGSLMTWNTRAETAASRAGSHVSDGTVKLLLDGQQRITTLYGVMRGSPPQFFEGNAAAFTGLYFHLDDEVFEFYAPAKMKDNPRWINVTDLMQRGLGGYMPQMTEVSGGDAGLLGEYVNRLNQLAQISDVSVHIEEVTGADKTLDVVVDIFNRVNSGGTKLSKGDLALAKICAAWPQARHQMNESLSRWKGAGYDFRLEWLLRNVNALVTGQAMFPALADAPLPQIQEGLTEADRLISQLLDVIAARLGLDHDRVLLSRYAFPVMARYLRDQGGHFPDGAARDKLLYWYLHAGMWGRFAGSTETLLNQDLRAVNDHGLDGLIDNMRRWRGELTVRADDFSGYSIGARFYPMLYLLTRTLSARDLGNGIPLSAQMLGHLSSLQVHHIFPKARLYAAGYSQGEVNAVANFCFLTQDSNLAISDQDPAVYFRQVESRHPGVLASQWIPMDESLWAVDRYLDFLAARRELLAQATNRFLDELLNGAGADVALPERPSEPVHVSVGADERTAVVGDLVAWLEEQGFAQPERDVEVTDPASGKLLSMAEAFWPRGLQEELGQPVVLELDADEADEEGLAALGYLVFNSPDALKEYVERQQVVYLTGAV